MTRKHLTLLAGAVALLTAAGFALAGGPDPVKVAAKAGETGSDGKQTIQVTIAVAAPWHIYANPVENDEFKDAQTTIFVKGKAKLASVKVQYPAGTKHVEKTGDMFKVYEDQVTIPVVVQRAAGDEGPLEVNVRYMACKEGVCLLPKTAKITVK